jgi:hypothetical protein
MSDEKLWTLQNGARVLTCELRDDTRHDAGLDVQVFEDGELMFTQRVGRRAAAQRVAELLRGDFVRSGWTGAA